MGIILALEYADSSYLRSSLH